VLGDDEMTDIDGTDREEAPCDGNVVMLGVVTSDLGCQVRRLGGGVFVVQASWSMEDHGSIRRVSLGGR
jgi:hypothetical protein